MTAPTAIPMPVEVPAPVIERYPYGLLSAARVITAPNMRWEAMGVGYSADSCGPGGGIWPNPCDNLQPGPTTVFTVTLSKEADSDDLFATLVLNAYGATTPVTVTVDGSDPQDLLLTQTSDAFPVAASSTVTVTGTIPATGPYPTCASSVDIAIPVTATAFNSQLSCIVNIPPIENAQKTFVAGLTEVGGKPFVIFEGLSCLALTVAEARTRAENRLALHEQFWVESQVDATVLRQDATVLNGGTAVGLSVGIGLLEDAIADQYGGIGTIHAARELAAPFTHAQIVQRDGSRMRSPLDNLYAFGAGYTTTGPDGTAAPDGQAWVYATGPVLLWRSEVQILEQFDQRKNVRLAIAERSYAVTADCLRVAVLLQIPEA
jgi:hypothetical protein